MALYVLLFVDLKTIISCLLVSHNWNHLASDPLVWRTLFYTEGWDVNNELAQRLLSGIRTRSGRNNSLISVAASVRNEIDVALNRMRRVPVQSSPQRARSQFRQSIASTTTSVDMSSSLWGCSALEGTLAPLTLDWQTLYKSRHEVDRRVYGNPASPALAAPEGNTTCSPPHVMTLSGHTDSVYCVEFDAYKVVTGSRDRTIKVWSLKTGRLKATLRGHEGSVLCLKFDSSGFMVSGSSDRKILVWDLSRGEIRKVMVGHNGGVLDLRMDKQWIVSWYVIWTEW